MKLRFAVILARLGELEVLARAAVGREEHSIYREVKKKKKMMMCDINPSEVCPGGDQARRRNPDQFTMCFVFLFLVCNARVKNISPARIILLKCVRYVYSYVATCVEVFDKAGSHKGRVGTCMSCLILCMPGWPTSPAYFKPTYYYYYY